jgi:tyrosine-protein kinase Etk/Wzc
MSKDNGKDGSQDRLSERVNLGELWLLVRRNSRVILGATAGVIAALAIGTLASRMQFRARGSLYLGELQSGTAATAPPGNDRWDFAAGTGGGDVGTEVEILKSQDLVKRAVFESGLNVSVAPLGWKPPRYVQWRLAHRDAHLLDQGAQRVLATRAALTTTTPRDLRVNFVGGGAYEVWSGDQRVGRSALGQEYRGADVSLTLLPGYDGLPAVGDVYALTVRPVDDVAEDAARRVNVSTAKGATSGDPVKVVGIDFSDPSPRAATRFVSALLQGYLDRRQSWKTEEATRAESFVTDQVASMKAALDDAEGKLADYKKTSKVVVLNDETKGLVDQLGKYEQQRMAARMQIASFEQIQELLKMPDAPIEQFLVGEGEDPVLAGLSNNLAQAQQELRRVEERFTPDAPAAREQKAQVDGQLKVVKNYVVGRFTRAQRQLDSINQMIAQFEKKLQTVPGAEMDLARLARQTDALGKMYAFLLERQQQTAVTKASTISRNRILDAPVPPRREDSPAAAVRLAIGTVLGLLLGTLFVVLRRLLSPAFQTEVEVRRALGALPVLASVPEAHVAHQGRSPLRAGTGTMFAEAFRHLRTNLYYADRSNGARVILVTSPCAGDGKTLCTFALAASLAADGKRVLVVEADLRRAAGVAGQETASPRTTGNHAMMPARGLSGVLLQRRHWTDVVRTVVTETGVFDAIAAGPAVPNPTELLSTPQLGALLSDARARYHLILIDSPPFPLVADALIMAMQVDRVLTVIRPGNSHRQAAYEHLERFASLGLQFGVVINGVDATATTWQRAYAQAYQSGRAPLAEAETAQAPA